MPTFIEAGFPQYEASNWIGFVAPTGTPKFIIEKLQRSSPAILDLPDCRSSSRNRGAAAEKLTRRCVRRLHRQRNRRKWGKVAKDANVKAE